MGVLGQLSQGFGEPEGGGVVKDVEKAQKAS